MALGEPKQPGNDIQRGRVWYAAYRDIRNDTIGGKHMTEDEMVAEIRNDMKYYDTSRHVWYAYPHDMVIVALVNEIKELKEELRHVRAGKG